MRSGMIAFVPVSHDSFIKEACCTYVLTPLQKPSQSVCAFGLTSWGFMAKKIIALLKENGGSYDIIAVK